MTSERAAMITSQSLGRCIVRCEMRMAGITDRDLARAMDVKVERVRHYRTVGVIGWNLVSVLEGIEAAWKAKQGI